MVCGLSVLLLLQGCMGTSLTMTAQHNDFPISFSEGIFGYNNELILRDGYEVVHHFKMEKSYFTWSWHYEISPFKPFGGHPKRIDLSNEFEELLRTNNGEAIVNLNIKGENEAALVFFSLPISIVTLGLIAPHSVDVTIEGDVIRLKTTTATSAVIPSTQIQHVSY